tara:strand:- start:22 stop:153 length:132 start_codon:yes stop_codon:yes gene_type:complete
MEEKLKETKIIKLNASRIFTLSIFYKIRYLLRENIKNKVPVIN